MNTYTFHVDSRSYVVRAQSSCEAMAVANATIDVPADFYAWDNESHPREFHAMFGAWD